MVCSQFLLINKPLSRMLRKQAVKCVANILRQIRGKFKKFIKIFFQLKNYKYPLAFNIHKVKLTLYYKKHIQTFSFFFLNNISLEKLIFKDNYQNHPYLTWAYLSHSSSTSTSSLFLLLTHLPGLHLFLLTYAFFNIYRVT